MQRFGKGIKMGCRVMALLGMLFIAFHASGADYCVSKGNSVVDEWIQAVQIGSYSKASGKNNGYADFTSETVELQPGASVSLKLTPGYAGYAYMEYWRVWLDLNHDSVFTDDEILYSGNASSAINANFVVPGDGFPGITRMRISMKYGSLPNSCEIFTWGEVEDYSVNISGTDITPPTVTDTNPMPEALNVPVNSSISVVFSEPMQPESLNAATFILNDGAAGVPGAVNGIGSTAVFVPNAPLAYNKRYTATLNTGAKDLAGNPIAADFVWSFTTVPQNPNYCNSRGNNATYEWIGNVTIGSFANNSASNGGYADFTSQVVPLAPGVVSITLKPGFKSSTYTEYWRIWIDLNHDSLFNSNEELFRGTSQGIIQSVMTIPQGGLPGNTRMRVSMKYAGAPTSCETFSYGEVEDYTACIAGQDTTPPSVSSVYPAENAAEVPVNIAVTATFSEEMDPGSINPQSFQLDDGSGTIVGSVTVNGSTATFIPMEPLASNTLYTARITTAAKDLSGNALPQEYVWNFTTGDNFSLAGQITLDGLGLPGVTVTLGGTFSASAITDSSGSFIFEYLIQGNYTVTPSGNYYFDPASIQKTVNGDVSSVDFTASANPALLVPEQYGTIQAAVNAAQSGDWISVADGTYLENVSITGSVRLQSRNGYLSTSIVGANPTLPVIQITGSNVTVRGFTIYESGSLPTPGGGIYMNNAVNCTIRDNRCGYNASHRNEFGIGMQNSNNNFILNNICNGNHYGIVLNASQYNEIKGNQMNDNHSPPGDVNDSGIGLYLYNASNNIVSWNTAEANARGINVYYFSSNNTISGNVFKDNADGIYLYMSDNNTFYLNNLMNNEDQVYFFYGSTANVWHSPTVLNYIYNANSFSGYLGNYYDDHVLTDSNGDGVTDAPYDLPAGGPNDDYPLAVPSVNFIIP